MSNSQDTTIRAARLVASWIAEEAMPEDVTALPSGDTRDLELLRLLTAAAHARFEAMSDHEAEEVFNRICSELRTKADHPIARSGAWLGLIAAVILLLVALTPWPKGPGHSYPLRTTRTNPVLIKTVTFQSTGGVRAVRFELRLHKTFQKHEEKVSHGQPSPTW
jgi:hypothetical protein